MLRIAIEIVMIHVLPSTCLLLGGIYLMISYEIENS